MRATLRFPLNAIICFVVSSFMCKSWLHKNTIFDWGKFSIYMLHNKQHIIVLKRKYSGNISLSLSLSLYLSLSLSLALTLSHPLHETQNCFCNRLRLRVSVCLWVMCDKSGQRDHFMSSMNKMLSVWSVHAIVRSFAGNLTWSFLFFRMLWRKMKRYDQFM